MAGRTRQPVKRPSAFWDSSALVALCANQENTSQARSWQGQYGIVVWWATPVEIASAMARLLRTKSFDLSDWRVATQLAQELSTLWQVVQSSRKVLKGAIALVEHHDLRAADSLQLAAALEWCNHVPRGRRFLCSDKKLREAALLVGFDV